MATLATDPHPSFVDNFQAEIDRLGCPAAVHPATGYLPDGTIELWDDEGSFITLLAISVSPETAVLAFGLYQLGLRTGRRAGEEHAMARLRQLIGVPSATQVRT